MVDEVWEARRSKLQKEVRRSVLELFQHTGGASAFVLSLDPNTPDLIVAAGPRLDVLSMLSLKCTPDGDSA